MSRSDAAHPTPPHPRLSSSIKPPALPFLAVAASRKAHLRGFPPSSSCGAGQGGAGDAVHAERAKRMRLVGCGCLGGPQPAPRALAAWPLGEQGLCWPRWRFASPAAPLLGSLSDV
ncbi:hypothetical protein FA09DRAFT_9251 [Tilletiopsis washingtonensis]|uniref:Uncharacterized protein n=1 Tax=Tilletiopsis washingtonensis TaxID=58919 RepID=A0A316ZJJ4_9BASI|nr:hypothetical protein FA09DRAFT_9251 [Tilletiopsis washingtonensis]PWO01299.1 hypothetical protein FA09DRAFT_9251 [Tilletiopsis washingtonensis]